MADILGSLWAGKWLIFIILAFIWWTLTTHPERDYFFIGGVLMAVFYGVYYHLYPNPYYLIVYFPFTFLFFYIFRWLKRRNRVFILETRQPGDGLNIDEGGRLLDMPREIYEQYTHIGDPRPAFWYMPHLITADLIDHENKVIYHAKYKELDNITPIAQKRTFLAMKHAWPGLIERLAMIEHNIEVIGAEKGARMFIRSLFTPQIVGDAVGDVAREMNENIDESIRKLTEEIKGETPEILEPRENMATEPGPNQGAE